MRNWSLGNSIKVIHRVKAMLLAERTGAEWELLDGDDWAEEKVQEGDGAEKNGKAGGDSMTNGKALGGHSGGDQTVGRGLKQKTMLEQTGILVKAEVGGGVREKEDERGKGGSGWTKIRGR